MELNTLNGFLSPRWRVLAGTVAMQLCTGAIYTWSLFVGPLHEKYLWSKNEIMLAYSINILTLALTTVFSGKMQDRIGPRITAALGGVALGGGLIMAAGADTLFKLYMTYGIVAGFGVGMVYPCPMATCVKWFPRQKGLITGVTVGAFGIGGVVFKGLIVGLLAGYGVSGTLWRMGVVYMVMIVAGAQLLKLPTAITAAGGSGIFTEAREYTQRDMLRTPSFYWLWASFLLGTVGGLFVIGTIKDLAAEIAGADGGTAAGMVAIASLGNAGGRLLFGFLSDRWGRIKTVVFLNFITAAVMAAMTVLEVDMNIFIVYTAVVSASFGGLLAIYPAITAELYGTRHLGGNYGIVFAAYGTAALLGPVLLGRMSTLSMFTAISVAAILAAVFAAGSRRCDPATEISSALPREQAVGE